MGWVVNATPRPLYPSGKRPGTHCIGGWVFATAGLDALPSTELKTASNLGCLAADDGADRKSRQSVNNYQMYNVNLHKSEGLNSTSC
jgi:hypothetical protein